MYYEEKLIDGVMCWRNEPDGKWTPYTLKELSARYNVLRQSGDLTLFDLKMKIVELLCNANDEKIAECDLNLYNALIQHPDVMEQMGNKPVRGTALSTLLENSVVMSSTDDDVTICVTAKAYEDAYKAAYPHPSDDPNHVHPHDCGYTITGHIHNCNCKPPCKTARNEQPKQVCTCVGSCRGKQYLGFGWVCALETKPKQE